MINKISGARCVSVPNKESTVLINRVHEDKVHRREVYNYFSIDNKHTPPNMCISY